MTAPIVDTDVIIRLVTNDDRAKQAAAAALFVKIDSDELTIAAPETVSADAVFVLASPPLYNLARARISRALIPLVQLPSIRARNRDQVPRAVGKWGRTV